MKYEPKKLHWSAKWPARRYAPKESLYQPATPLPFKKKARKP